MIEGGSTQDIQGPSEQTHVFQNDATLKVILVKQI